MTIFLSIIAVITLTIAIWLWFTTLVTVKLALKQPDTTKVDIRALSFIFLGFITAIAIVSCILLLG